MADPLAPQDIARRTFDIARRGYEQQEVRGFLHEVSALLERLTRSETELRERAERAEARLGVAEQPDEAVLLEVLGAETTRVLTSAHEAAAEIRTKAEGSAERIIAEATSEAAGIRGNAVRDADALVADTKTRSESILEAARTELERRSAEADEAAARIRGEGQEQAQALREQGQAELARAREEAEAALEAARQQGREMVAEAQAVRERVLRDLAVRRKRARQQVEKLNAGRERLLQAYDLVRHTIDEATNELNVSLTDARIAANAAARRIEEEPDTTLEQLDAEVAAAGLADLPIAELDHDDHDDHDDQEDHEDEGSGPLSGEVPVIEVVADERVVEREPATGAPSEAASLVALDERRGRKGRRRKSFEGLPAGELTVVEPPSPDEGVRILAEPEEPAAETVAVAPEAGRGATGAVDAQSGPALDDQPGAVAATDDEGSADKGAADGLVAVEEAPEGAGPSGDGVEDDTPPEESPERVVAAAHEAESSPADDVFARLRAQSEVTATTPESTATDATDAADATDATDATAGGAPDVLVETATAATVDDASDILAESATEALSEDSVEASAEVVSFVTRAEAVGPIEKELGRRLKRALADEQNEVLDLLRRAKPKGVEGLLPDADLHAARWADAVVATLGEAAAAGVGSTGGTASSVADLADELARSLTAPLRERIDRSFAASDGNLDDIADRVRALYREWKGQRLTEASQHFAAAAYARGVFDAIDAGSKVHWVVDPSAGACPDCDDNVLAGAIPKGDEFPTGNPCAPAHPGCHCLVLAAPR